MQFNFGSNIGSATTNGSELGPLSMGTMNAVTAPVTPSVTTAPNLSGGGVTNPSTVLDGGNNGGGNGPQQGTGFWSKDGGAGMALAGIQTLGNLWNSFQSHKMAKQQMSFAREQWDTNLQNQTQTYNTALEDRIRARHNTEGRGGGETDAYLAKHSL